MGWTAHIQRTAKPGTLLVGGGLGEGVLSPMTFLRRQPEKTGRKLLFPQTTSPGSEEHADFPLSLTRVVPELQVPQPQMLPSQFSHLSNGCHLCHPKILTAVKKTNLEATERLSPERPASDTKKRSPSSIEFTFPVDLLYRINGWTKHTEAKKNRGREYTKYQMKCSQ